MPAPIKPRITLAVFACAVAAAPMPLLAQARDAQPPFAEPMVADTTLGTVAGREDTTQLATASQSAGVARNSVGDNVRTGDATIADNAFQNLSGLSILNVNTGNNVAINAAMNVNIALHPGQ